MKRGSVLGLIAVWFMIVGACREAPPHPADETENPGEPNPVHQDVLGEVRQYYADLSARDWDAFAAHFWPGATLTTVWQPAGEDAMRVVAMSVPDFVAQAPEGPDSQPIFEERMTDAQVRAEAGLAQVWARYEARFGRPDSLMEWTGIDAFTLIRHEGRWKITSLAYAPEQQQEH